MNKKSLSEYFNTIKYLLVYKKCYLRGPVENK